MGGGQVGGGQVGGGQMGGGQMGGEQTSGGHMGRHILGLDGGGMHCASSILGGSITLQDGGGHGRLLHDTIL